MKTTRKAKPQKNATTKTEPAVNWFVIRGFKKDNKDEVGFLSIDKNDIKNVYKIVDDLEDAMRFPSTNIYNTKGFGTPKQWLEFFKGEDALSEWKFHLVKVRK